MLDGSCTFCLICPSFNHVITKLNALFGIGETFFFAFKITVKLYYVFTYT